jgi:hypothetical protein
LFFNEISARFCDAKQVFTRRDSPAPEIQAAFRDVKRPFGSWCDDRQGDPRFGLLPRA